MPDGQASKITRSFAMPIMLVGALAAGSLVPHLSRSNGNATNPAVRSAASVPTAAAPNSAESEDGEDPTLGLLADYFGVDISTSGLRRQIRQAARNVSSGHEGNNAPKDAAILRAFFCLDLRWDAPGVSKLSNNRRLTWATPPRPGTLPPDCENADEDVSDRQTLVADIERYFNDDARRDEVVTTRPILGVAPPVVDERKLVAKDFDRVNKTPLQWALVADALAQRRAWVQFLIATVPDPIDSYETWQFDPNVDAIRQGIEDSGFLFDRFHLPGVANRLKAASVSTTLEHHDRRPGVIVFRRKARETQDANTNALLLLFLVPETPVAGIHEEPFQYAMDFVSGWMRRHDLPDPEVRILGPSFSGATPSLARALNNAKDLLSRRELGCVHVTIVSGSASNDSNRDQLEGVSGGPLSVRFRATAHSNSAIDSGLQRFFDELGMSIPDASRAELSESSTGYGTSVGKQQEPSAEQQSQADTPGKLSIKYPFNIAQLRNDVSRDGDLRREPAATLIPGFRPLSLEDLYAPTDQLPVLSPKTTSAAVELTLDALLDTVGHDNIRVVNIDSTDIRDKLFLIRKLRERAPDTLITTSDTDLFEAHPDQAEWLKGVIVASTYPLHQNSQKYVFPYQRGGAHQFSSVNSQGIYNAALALLNYKLGDSEDDPASPRAKAPPPLVDYAGIGADCVKNNVFEPAVWISMVGREQIVPLRAYCDVEEEWLKAAMKNVEENAPESEEPKPLKYVFRPRMMGEKLLDKQVPLPFVGPAIVIGLGLFACALALAPYIPTSKRKLADFLHRYGLAERVGVKKNVDRRSPKSSVMSMALAGAAIPVVFLGTTFAIGAHASILPPYVWMAGVLACANVILSVWLQWRGRSRRYKTLWLLTLAAAVLFAVYAWLQMSREPQLFLERTLDLTTYVSPLAVVIICGLVPILLALVERWRLRVHGDSQPARRDWRASLITLGRLCNADRAKLLLPLMNSHSSLFALPKPKQWRAFQVWCFCLPVAWTVVAYFAMFRVGSIATPILTAEGAQFGWGVLIIVTVLQFAFATAVTQFVYFSVQAHKLLECAAQSLDDLPYSDVPPDLRRMSLFPTPPRLRHLGPLARQSAGTRAALESDLKSERRRRWFESDTWRLLRGYLRDAHDRPPSPFDAQVKALSAALVVRELLSRLTINLLLAGPAVLLLVLLHQTFYFDRSHRLLALIWVDVAIAAAAVTWAIVKEDRDTLISKLRGTTPGEIEMNWDFILKLLVYVALPLLALFATEFPGLGSGLSGVLQYLQPVQRLPGS